MKKKLLLDGTKLLYHLDRLNRWNGGEKVFPIFIEISPIGFCNQACIFCAYEYLKKKVDRLNINRTLEILNELSELGVKSVFYSGEGEPLLHPNLAKMINHSHAIGLDCALNTNGILMTKEISSMVLKDLSWVRFSINAGNRESYKKIHKAKKSDFDKLIQNLEDAAEIKKSKRLDVSLGAQLVYIKQPFDEILELANILKNIGLDYFAVKQFNKHPLGNFDIGPVTSEIDKLKEIESLSNENFYVTVRESFDKQKQKRNYKKCFGFDFFAEIKCDGGVYPCGPLLGITEYCYGNIHQNTFRDIWFGAKRQEALNKIYNNIDIVRCMPNCRLHNINSFLWQLKTIPAHINFI